MSHNLVETALSLHSEGGDYLRLMDLEVYDPRLCVVSPNELLSDESAVMERVLVRDAQQ